MFTVYSVWLERTYDKVLLQIYPNSISINMHSLCRIMHVVVLYRINTIYAFVKGRESYR